MGELAFVYRIDKSIISGATSLAHVNANVKGADWRLAGDVLRRGMNGGARCSAWWSVILRRRSCPSTRRSQRGWG
jgi:hypothetical protein